MNEKRKGIWKAVVLTVLFMSAQVLLKEDGKVFAVWWLTILVLGWCSFPLCQYLFSGFRDRGYLVAKIFGIAGDVLHLLAREAGQRIILHLGTGRCACRSRGHRRAGGGLRLSGPVQVQNCNDGDDDDKQRRSSRNAQYLQLTVRHAKLFAKLVPLRARHLAAGGRQGGQQFAGALDALGRH